MSKRHDSSEHDAELGAKPIFVPECASFNIESMPGQPWGLSSADLLRVESNMMWRCVLYPLKTIYLPSDLKLIYQTRTIIRALEQQAGLSHHHKFSVARSQ